MIFHYSLRSCGEFWQCPQELKKKPLIIFIHSLFPYLPICLANIPSVKKQIFLPATSTSRQVYYLHNTVTCQQAASVSKCHISSFT